ncbi:MAG: hypothetical protein ACKOAS_09260, partial [Verrucomicrobiota bacterium]
MRVHPVVYYLFKTTIRLVLVLVFAGIPLALLALRTFGIGFGAREALEQALSNPAIQVRIGKVMLDPFAGLVAREVAVSETGNTKRLLAEINRLSISLNISELMNRRIAVDTLSLDKARASIPLGPPPNPPRLEATDINADLVVLGDRLRVSQFEALIEGIRLRVTGEILNPFDFPTPEAGEQKPLINPELLQKILGNLRDTSFPDGEPRLVAEFEIDAAQPESLTIPRLDFTCGKIVHPNLPLESASLQGSYVKKILRIPVLQIRDATGQLQSSAEWNSDSGNLQASVISNLDPAAFLNHYADGKGALSKLKFPQPPQLNAELRGSLKETPARLSATGGLLIPEIIFENARFTDAALDFSWKDGIFYAREIQAQAKRGS